MKSRSLIPLYGALVAALALMAAALVALSDTLAAGVTIGLFTLAGFAIFADAADVLLRLYLRRIYTTGADDGPRQAVSVSPTALSGYERRLHLRPFAIVASVYRMGPWLEDFVDAMEPYRDRIYLIDDGSNDGSVQRLRAAGYRCLSGGVNRKKPGALRALLPTLPRDIRTLIVMDPDSFIRNSGRFGISDLEAVVFDFQQRGSGAACPRLVIREDGWLADMQALEYSFSFVLGRQSLGDHSVTSGIAIYRRDSLESILEDHTLSVYAEDLENSIHLLSRGERIHYDGRLVVETEAKRTLHPWFSQRVGWAYGFARCYGRFWKQLWRIGTRRALLFYHFVIYLGVFSLLLHPLKLVSLAILATSFANGVDGLLGSSVIPDTALTHPGLFLTLYLKYTAITTIAFVATVRPEDRRRLLPVAPMYFFYALALVVPTTVGFANWITLRLTGRRTFRDHYQADDGFAGRELKRRLEPEGNS